MRGAREMAQGLRALAALADVGLVPSIHMAAHNYLSFQFQDRQCHLLTFTSTVYTCNTYTCRQIFKNVKFKWKW